MLKKIFILLVVVFIFIFGFEFFNTKNNENNTLIFYKESFAGMKDCKLLGYFSNNILEKYEISYYVEYENETFAKDDYDRLMYWQNPENEDREDIKHTYTLKENCLYTTITYIIKSMDADIVKRTFETSNTSINKKQFENYAKSQGYSKYK